MSSNPQKSGKKDSSAAASSGAASSATGQSGDGASSLRPDPTLVQLPLRKSGRLVESSRWPVTQQSDPPRALKTLAKIVDENLCHRCGSCVGICPTNVLGLDDDEYPIVKNLSACTDCDLCVRVCPGDEFNAESISHQLFGYTPDPHDMHGHFEQAYLSHAADKELRRNSTSGGLVTGLLLYLLERGEIDGALVVGSDDSEKWKGKPFIARSREELLGSIKSKYAIAPTNVAFDEIREVDGRYAIVGLPCQIHGYHKAARLDKRIKDRVVLTMGLFCHAAVEHEPMRFLWNQLGEKQQHVSRFISRVGKHPGTPHLEMKDSLLEPLYFPNAKGYRPSSMEVINILYRLYTPDRCLTCYDSTSEFADIAVGDPWLPSPADDINLFDGYSFALARTSRGQQFLKKASDENAIVLRPLEAKIARTSNTMMGEEKRWRAFRIIETHRRQGKAVPEYGFRTPKASGKQLLLTEGNMLSHILCFAKRGRRTVFRLLFTKFGYYLLWLNHKRRVFRDWRKTHYARIARRWGERFADSEKS